MSKSKAAIKNAISNKKPSVYIATNPIRSFNIFGISNNLAKRFSNRKEFNYKSIKTDWEMVGNDISFASKKVMLDFIKKNK